MVFYISFTTYICSIFISFIGSRGIYKIINDSINASQRGANKYQNLITLSKEIRNDGENVRNNIVGNIF